MSIGQTLKLSRSRPVKFSFLVGLTGCSLLLFLLRGSYGGLAVLGAVVVFVFFMTPCLLWLGVSKMLGRSTRCPRTGLRILAVGIAPLLGLVPVSHYLAYSDVKEAKEFVQRMVPRLDEYKSQHGIYPAHVEFVLQPGEELPRLFFRINSPYSTTYQEYRFEFFEPQSVMGTWVYRSNDRNWVEG